MDKKRFLNLISILLINITIIIWVFIEVLKPSVEASNIYSKNFYTKILSKSNASIEAIDKDIEDENKEELSSIFLKYLIGVDFSDPKSYIETQIPLIAYLDISSILGNKDAPILIADNDKQTNENDKNDSNKNNTNENDKNNQETINEVKPNEIDVKPKKLDSSKPLVLIFHTHTTESYNPNRTPEGNFTTDYNKNITKVGEEIKKELENKYGIATIHDITIHDLPSREKGYEKSRPTVQAYLKKYPSIKIIIDLHRDAGTDVSKTTVKINNEKYARPMFVIGKKNRNYKKNEEMSLKISENINKMYPGLSRGVLYKDARYNQDLSTKMVLLEIGSNLNSLDEAIRTGKIISKAIALFLK